MLKLSDDDSRAVDLLLDSRKVTTANTNGDGATGRPAGFLVNPDHFSKRLIQVEQLLGLLQQLPAGEPPKHLLARTLEAIPPRAGSGLVSQASEDAASTASLRPQA